MLSDIKHYLVLDHMTGDPDDTPLPLSYNLIKVYRNDIEVVQSNYD